MAAEAKAPLLEGRGGATPAQTIGNIVVSIVGTGVLGLPYAFRNAGWLAGALAVAGAGAATFYCMLLLLECRDKLREQEAAEVEEENGHQHRSCNYTYGDLGEKCFGRAGRYLTEATIILSQTGGTVAYLVFIGQNVSSVFSGSLSPTDVVLAVLLPIQAALSFIRSLSSLAHFSILADACTVLAVATVVKQDVELLSTRGAPPFAGRSAVAADPRGVAFACGFAVFCFEGFCMTLALEASMSDRTKFRPVLFHAIAGVTAVYACFGAAGYLAYGDATMDIVTLNLPNTWSTAVVKVAMCVALALTFPIMMHPIHEIVEARLLGWLRRKQRGGGGGGVVERAAVQASRVAVVAALCAVACFVPAFGSFASLVGSTVCALLSFVLPALFHIRVAGASAMKRAVDWGILVFGLAFAAHGLYTVVAQH
ncbi:unnamed protein product [Urochloa humidicola]